MDQERVRERLRRLPKDRLAEELIDPANRSSSVRDRVDRPSVEDDPKALAEALRRSIDVLGQTNDVDHEETHDKAMSSGPARISINGRYLDEVETRIEFDHGRWIAFARKPAEHHRAIIAENAVTLRIPPLTALQLYVDGTLPVDGRVPVSLEVGGRALGEFFVEWVRCAERHYAGDPMFLRLRALRSRRAQAARRANQEGRAGGDSKG